MNVLHWISVPNDERQQKQGFRPTIPTIKVKGRTIENAIFAENNEVAISKLALIPTDTVQNYLTISVYSSFYPENGLYMFFFLVPQN